MRHQQAPVARVGSAIGKRQILLWLLLTHLQEIRSVIPVLDVIAHRGIFPRTDVSLLKVMVRALFPVDTTGIYLRPAPIGFLFFVDVVVVLHSSALGCQGSSRSPPAVNR